MKKVFLVWLTNTKIWSWFILNIMPFIRFSVYYTKFRGIDFITSYRILDEGDVILTLDEKKATRIVPGLMTHAAYCVNNSSKSGKLDYEVAEMTHHNFTRSYWFDICKESDRVIIVTYDGWTPEHKTMMHNLVPMFWSSLYDTKFAFGIGELYCSELPWQLDRMAANRSMTTQDMTETKFKGVMDVDLSDFAGIGRQYISPDGLLFARNARVRWDSYGELTGMTGPEAEQFCKDKGYI